MALVCENDEKQESQEASRLAFWNNSYRPAGRVGQEGELVGIHRRELCGRRELAVGQGGQRERGRTKNREAPSSWYVTCSSVAVSKT